MGNWDVPDVWVQIPTKNSRERKWKIKLFLISSVCKCFTCPTREHEK